MVSLFFLSSDFIFVFSRGLESGPGIVTGALVLWQQNPYFMDPPSFCGALNYRSNSSHTLLNDDIPNKSTLFADFSAISELITKTRLPVIAAGGVASVQHLVMLKKLGAEGAIIGKALYTGDIDLKQALKAVEQA